MHGRVGGPWDGKGETCKWNKKRWKKRAGQMKEWAPGERKKGKGDFTAFGAKNLKIGPLSNLKYRHLCCTQTVKM